MSKSLKAAMAETYGKRDVKRDKTKARAKARRDKAKRQAKFAE